MAPKRQSSKGPEREVVPKETAAQKRKREADEAAAAKD